MTAPANGYALALHGGAGAVAGKDYAETETHLFGLASTCRDRLVRGAKALDVVEFAVNELETCGLYVAGRGSAPNSAGHVELDASIMDGATRGAGVRSARDVVALAHDYGARVLINGNADMARECGADGVHLQAEQLMQGRSRPDGIRLLAASCHDREELLQAAALGADFVVLSPVLPTQSHPGAPTLGWERFAELCLDLPMPVYALGGMRTDMLETAMTHSAHGVALLSGIW